jgi:hypothetical protein
MLPDVVPDKDPQGSRQGRSPQEAIMAQTAVLKPAAAVGSGRYFYFGAALVMLATVLVGFSPTFYLKGVVTAPVAPGPLPLYLVAHGCAMTAWCLFFVWQTWLAASGRTAMHRRTGWVGCGLLALAILTAVYATLQIVRLRVDAGFSAQAALESHMNVVMFSNLASLPWLAGLFLAAVLLRWRREWHGRLIYWSIFISIGPAFGGGGTRLIEPLVQSFVPVPATLVALPVALVALVIHDLRSRGRLHPATFVGAVVTFVAPLPGVLFALSPAGQQVFLSLG